MKLVELLARELDEWPEYCMCGCDSITQDADGELNSTKSGRTPVMVRGQYWNWGSTDYLGVDIEIATDYETAIVTREMWEAERAKLAGKDEWDDKSLPPVGIECMLANEKVRVLTYIRQIGQKVLVVSQLGEDGQINLCPASAYSPIRTQEQIAAQEREEAAQQMLSVAEGIDAGMYVICCALYDAGYRKQEQSE